MPFRFSPYPATSTCDIFASHHPVRSTFSVCRPCLANVAALYPVPYEYSVPGDFASGCFAFWHDSSQRGEYSVCSHGDSNSAGPSAPLLQGENCQSCSCLTIDFIFAGFVRPPDCICDISRCLITFSVSQSGRTTPFFGLMMILDDSS